MNCFSMFLAQARRLCQRGILILDGRFQTTEKIGLNSTYGELKKNYHIDELSPYMENVTLIVSNINALFNIKVSELQDGWWNERKKVIDKSKIPSSTKFDQVIIWWR